MHKSLSRLSAILLITFAVTANAKPDRHVEYPTYNAHVNGVSIAYQEFGQAEKGTILLVMGLGAQMIVWNDDLVLALANDGYRVIRFDNRDIGWSEKLDHLPTPGIMTGIRYKLGFSLGAPYKLDDMAADAYALLKYLEVDKAHVVGVSMGGMIAQIMAAKYPETVLSLTSIMSTSGAKHLPTSSVDIDFDSRGDTRDEIINSTVELVRKFGGSAATIDKAVLRKRIARTYDRSHYPDGGARQLWAIVDSGDRVELLKSIRQPTLVLHGDEDTLVPYEAGQHTAELVNGSRFVTLKGMGHSIDEASRPIIVREILQLAAGAVQP